MADAATSSHYRPQARGSRTATTSAVPRPAMAPFLSPQRASPPRTAPAPQTPSPNYFDFRVDASSYVGDSPQNVHARNNWSTASSSVRSTAARSPSIVPHDQDAEYAAFRRHSDGKAFNLSGLNHFNSQSQSQSQSHSQSTDTGTSTSTDRIQRSTNANSPPSPPQGSSRSRTAPRDMPSHRSRLDPSSAELSRSPKRLLSPGSATESSRRASPPTYHHGDSETESDASKDLSNEMLNAQPRFKLPLDSLSSPASGSLTPRRADTIAAPPTNADAKLMVAPQYVAKLIDSKKPQHLLLLDLRLATHFAISHIMSALSLCLPTTLLKRPSFNARKLAETFKDDEERQHFESWRSAKYIVVYDASSSTPKDASVCFNTIHKFQREGYDGTLLIVRGGFKAFAAQFPSYIDYCGNAGAGTGVANASASDPPMSSNSSMPEVAPVVGGCPMPATDLPANPFFGNIRQNMDLIGGVGRIPLSHPTRATQTTEAAYPAWLKDASSSSDQGMRVSNRFEQIERREKKRMEDALSGHVSWEGSPKQQQQQQQQQSPSIASPSSDPTVRIAGLEQGSKNRYNNIWPFEHSRVRLQGIPSSGCDYFNASYVQSSGSNKRYISTQAPIPATFNDFWNVVWQQDVRVIVMLTAEKEGAQIKAHNYWDRKQYGALHLDFLTEKRASLEPSRIFKHRKRLSAARRTSASHASSPQVPIAPVDSSEVKSSSSEQPYVIVRTFTLSHAKHPFEPIREITQLHYANWPDFGAPANPAHLVGLVEQCDAVVRTTNNSRSSLEPEPPAARPVLVHCSAGCGRTGTFCTVDSVIDMLKRQRISRHSPDATPMELSDMADEKTTSSDIYDVNDTSNNFDAAFATPESAPAGSNAGKDVNGTWLSRDDQDLVAKTVEEFRHQRISMVQSLRQFVLCYESIMQWIVEQADE